MVNLKVKDLDSILTSEGLCNPTACVLWDSTACKVIKRSWSVENVTSPERDWSDRNVCRVRAIRDPENENRFVVVISVK